LAYRVDQSSRRVLLVTAPRKLKELLGTELHGVLDRVLRGLEDNVSPRTR
jgi:hypothetical protein